MKHLSRNIFLLFVLSPFSTAHSNTVSLATLSDWPPYISFILKNDGYAAEIARAAFDKAGYTAEISYMTWARAESLSAQGKYDAIFPTYYSQKRTITHVYSDSFLGSPIGFVKRTDHDIRYRELADLRDYRIGVVRGYAYTKTFDDANYLSKDAVASDLVNFRKLLRNRIDLAITDRFTFQYLMQLHEPDHIGQLEFMEPLLEEKDLHVAFSKNADNHLELLNAFNHGLKLLRDSGELDTILQKLPRNLFQ